MYPTINSWIYCWIHFGRIYFCPLTLTYIYTRIMSFTIYSWALDLDFHWDIDLSSIGIGDSETP